MTRSTRLAVQPLLVDDTGRFRVGSRPDNFGGIVRPREVDLCTQIINKGSLAHPADVGADLGHDNELLSRKVELLNRLSEDDLGESVRVDLYGKGC